MSAFEQTCKIARMQKEGMVDGETLAWNLRYLLLLLETGLFQPDILKYRGHAATSSATTVRSDMFGAQPHHPRQY